MSFDSDYDVPDKLKYTAEFVDCVFNGSSWTWTPGQEESWTILYQNDGVVKVWETRPGRSGTIQVWPLTAPIDPADFNVDGVVDPTDFTLMSVDFGRNVGESRFVRYYDLVPDGVVNLNDFVEWSGNYLGLEPSAGIILIADQLANTQAGKDLLKVVAIQQSSPVVEAIMAEPNLRGALEPFLQLTTVEEENTTTPTATTLNQNYPNPFNPATTINFSLAEETMVKLSVYNLAGQSIKTLAASTLPAGTHQLTWDGTDDAGRAVRSGIYLCDLRAGNNTFTKKMLLLH